MDPFLPTRIWSALTITALSAGLLCVLLSYRAGPGATRLLRNGALLCLVVTPLLAFSSCAQMMVDADSGFARRER